MASVARRQWFQQAGAAYPSIDRVIYDVDVLLQPFPTLQPKLENYAFEDGTVVKLICLEGTIPIMYKSQVYNIPVCLWLHHSYPRSAPICYVKPTQNMLVKAGKHVDPSGKIYLPYLHYWPGRFEHASLLELVKSMTEIFSTEPPVYSKPSNQSATLPAPANHIPRAPSPQPHQIMPPMQYPPQYPPQAQPPPPQVVQVAQPVTRAATEFEVQALEEEAQARRSSLLSAVSEKISRILKQQHETMIAEQEALLMEQRTLHQHEQQLDSSMQQLQSSLTTVQSETKQLEGKIARLQQQLAELQSRGEVDVDKDIKPAAVLHQQLYDLVAEEHAIEDTIYVLNKALQQERIDLTLFMKLVRGLARDQFMKKALITKIADYLGIKV